MKIEFSIKRRLPKAPKPTKTGGAHGTRKGAKEYNRSDNRRVESAAKGGDD